MNSLWRRHCPLQLALTVVCAFSPCFCPSFSQTALAAERSKPTEYEVKAAYLYNFSQFVEWPASAPHGRNHPFKICVLGDNPFGNALEATIAAERNSGRTVVAKAVDTPENARDCQILFISASESGQVQEILATLDKASILTVSDLPQFTERGGMIQFVLEGDRVRFEVNLAMAQRAGLSLGSDLLKVAVNASKQARGD